MQTDICQMSWIGAAIMLSLLSAYQILSLGSVLILFNSRLESVCLFIIFSSSVYVGLCGGWDKKRWEREKGGSATINKLGTVRRPLWYLWLCA